MAAIDRFLAFCLVVTFSWICIIAPAQPEVSPYETHTDVSRFTIRSALTREQITR